MHKKSSYGRVIYVFKKWTGKSYAVFSSLKKQISISELRFELHSYSHQIKRALSLILSINTELELIRIQPITQPTQKNANPNHIMIT